jgi:putative ABC transport system permease protein
MFDIDKWQEVIDTLRKNKLRTLLTAAGVFWGIFMLIVMLGFGAGFERGIRTNVATFSHNSLYVWGERTSMAYDGLQPGRWVPFDVDDIAAIRQLDGIEYLAPRIELGGWREGSNVVRGEKTGNFSVNGDYPEFMHIQSMNFVGGRFINDLDIRDRRKVAVIGKNVREVMFAADEDPLGKYLQIRGVYFQVVGMFETHQNGEQGDRQDQTIFVPFTTFQQAFNTGNRIGWFALTALPDRNAAELEQKVVALLKERHRVHPDDDQGIGSFNAAEEWGKISNLFAGIKIFLWLVGTMTLLAGVLGVSNIMLIVVKERTKEIGVRKAIGATPMSVISLVIQEAVALTALAGYSGVVAGVAVIELCGAFWPAEGLANGAFAAPEVSLGTAIIATIVLIVSGAIAGIIPARHAASIEPVVALRAE